MVRKFLANLLLLLLANLLVKPFWIFGIDRVVQNQVGQELYGLYATLLSLSMLPGVLLDLGINQYNNTTIARDNSKLTSMFQSLSTVKLVLVFFYIINMLILAVLFGYREQIGSLLIVIIINQAIAGLLLYIRTHFSALHLFKTDTLLSISDKLIMIMLCGPVLWWGWLGGMSIEKFVYLQMVAYIITLVISLLLLAKHIQKPKFRFGISNFREVWKQSKPYALLALLMVIYMRADTVILQRSLADGNVQAGIYAQSNRLLDAMNMVAILSASLLLPIFARMMAQKENVGKLTQVSVILLLLPAVSLAACCWFGRVDIMELLYHRNEEQPNRIFAILMLSFIPVCGNYVYGTLITASGNLRFLNRLSFAALILNISLNLLLVHQYKALGTAIAALATHSMLFLAQVTYCVKTGLLELKTSFGFRFAIYTTLIFLTAWYATRFGLGVLLGGAIIVSVGAAFGLKIISYPEIKKLLIERIQWKG